MKYIDGEKVIKRIDKAGKKIAKNEMFGTDTLQGLAGAIAIIKDEMKNGVEVTRCADCDHYDGNNHCSAYGFVNDDDFCSWAERKEKQ